MRSGKVCMLLVGFLLLAGTAGAQDAITSATQNWLTGSWAGYEAGEGVMTNAEAKQAVAEMLHGKKETDLMILATSLDGLPVTTIAEFTMDNDTMTLYGMHEFDTEKLIQIAGNPWVCLSSNAEYSGFSGLVGLQLKGTAELIDGDDPLYDQILINVIPYEEYADMLGGLPLEVVRALLKNMLMISKITIYEATAGNSAFKEEGYRTYQRWVRGLTLASFTAVPGHRSVTLGWATDTEVDLDGFDLYRSTAGGDYEKINATRIDATGSEISGGVYSYTDTELQNRTTYTYLLTSVDDSGAETSHGPVTAMPRLIYLFQR